MLVGVAIIGPGMVDRPAWPSIGSFPVMMAVLAAWVWTQSDARTTLLRKRENES